MSKRQLFRRATEFLDKNNYFQALYYLEQVLAIEPNNEQVKQLIIDASIKHAQALDTELDTSPMYGNQHGRTMNPEREARVKDAILSCARAIELDPRCYRAWWKQGSLYADRLNDVEQAQLCLDRLSELLELDEVTEANESLNGAKEANPIADLQSRIHAAMLRRSMESKRKEKLNSTNSVTNEAPSSPSRQQIESDVDMSPSKIKKLFPNNERPARQNLHDNIAIPKRVTLPVAPLPENWPQVKSFLKAFIDKGETDVDFGEGQTALMFAIDFDDAEFAQSIIAAGADLSHVNYNGESAVTKALTKGNSVVLSAMIDRLLSTPSNSSVLWQVDEQGLTPLLHAAQAGNTGTVKLILDAYRKLERNEVDVDKNGRSALHYAAAGGHKDVVNTLLELAPATYNINMRSPVTGTTPLIEACLHSTPEMVAFLLDVHNADPNIGDNKNRTPLIISARRPNDTGAPIVSLLVGVPVAVEANSQEDASSTQNATEPKEDGVPRKCICNIDAEDKSGLNALHHACLTGNHKSVELLLKAGADINKTVALSERKQQTDSLTAEDDMEGWTPLMIASWCNHPECVSVLLQHTPNLDVCNPLGETALHLTAQKGNEICAKMLIEAGANVNGKFHSIGTPLSLSALHGHIPIMRLLLAHGADANEALHCAARQNDIEVMKVLLEHSQVDANAFDFRRKTPLEYSCMNDEVSVPMIQLLLDHSANPNMHSPNSRPPLWCVAEKGLLEVVQLLIRAGADLECRWEGMTPLHAAAKSGHVSVVLELIQAGASCKAVTLNNHDDVLNTAVRNFRNDIVKELLHCPQVQSCLQEERYKLEQLLNAESACDVNSWDLAMRPGSKWDPIILASSVGNEQALVFLLEAQDTSRRVFSEILRHALFAAVKHGCIGIIKYLLDNGLVAKDCEDSSWLTPIQRCICSTNVSRMLETLEVLLNYGCPLEVTPSQAQKRSKSDPRYEEHLLSPLAHAAKRGIDDAVAMFLDAGVDCNGGHFDSKPTTPLILAVVNNNLSTASLLLTRGASVDAIEPSTGMTALHHAVQVGSEKLVSLLLAHGANANISTVKNSSNALHLAAARDYRDIVALLVQWNRPGTWFVEGSKGDAQTTTNDQNKKQVHTPININAKRKPDGYTALHIASALGYQQVVEVLLRVPGIDADLKDDTQEKATALFLAAKFGRLSVVQALVNTGKVNLFTICGNSTPPTSLASSSAMSQQEQIEYLTALAVAAIMQHKEVVSFLQKAEKRYIDKLHERVNSESSVALTSTTRAIQLEKKLLIEKQRYEAKEQEVQQLQAEIAKLKQELEEAQQDVLRAKAQCENIHKQMKVIAKENRLLKTCDIPAINEDIIPEDIICPITMEIMKDPVVSISGHTFDRQALERFLETNPYDPITRAPCRKSDLRPNFVAKQRIESWIKFRQLRGKSIGTTPLPL